MTKFKEAYADYMKEKEDINEAPEGRVFYEYCKSKTEENNRGRWKWSKYAVAAVMSVLLLSVVVKTNVIGYAYDSITDFISTYILKSKEADVKDMVIEEDKKVYEKTFASLSDVSKEYDIDFMMSDLAYEWNDKYVAVIGYGTSDKINGIRIIAPYYIMGDLPIIESELVTPDETSLINPLSHGIYGEDLRVNEKYQTPVYLSMYVNVSGKDMENGNQAGYDDVDFVAENYVSSANGMNFVITATEFNIGEEIDGLNPMIKAVCTKDDVQYRLEGRVSMETMKEIIDSFSY